MATREKMLLALLLRFGDSRLSCIVHIVNRAHCNYTNYYPSREKKVPFDVTMATQEALSR